jgi:hypothetical protein
MRCTTAGTVLRQRRHARQHEAVAFRELLHGDDSRRAAAAAVVVVVVVVVAATVSLVIVVDVVEVPLLVGPTVRTSRAHKRQT